MKGEHEESGSPRLASLREGIQVIQENHERLLIRAEHSILITEMSLCGVVGGVVLCRLLNFIFKEEERRVLQSCYDLSVTREEREEREEQVISHSLRCLRCHHSHHALKAPLHVWTGSYPQFIRQTGQIFGDFNDMLPSTWIKKINKLRGRQHSISTWNSFRRRAKNVSVFLSIPSSLVWSHQLRVLMRGENIPVLLKICYSAANSIPKVLAGCVRCYICVAGGLTGADWCLWWDE